MRYLILLSFICSAAAIQAQTDSLALDSTLVQSYDYKTHLHYEALNEVEDTLGILGYTMVNDTSSEIRFASCRKFIPTLVNGLKYEDSFKYPFERLKNISIIYPPDSSFRIFSWELYVSPTERRYYGAVQLNTSDINIFPLIDRSFEFKDLQVVGDNKDWYGALYYNVMPLEEGGNTDKYLVFGYDHLKASAKRKVIDVLTISKEKIEFGAPIFVDRTDSLMERRYNRIIIEYFAESSLGCNYDDDLKMIVFDHVSMVNGPFGPVQVPDGTYSGYKYLQDEKIWLYEPKVFHTIIDEPLMPEPILDGRKGPDLFGKKKEKQ